MVGTKMSKTQRHNLSEEYLNSLTEEEKLIFNFLYQEQLTKVEFAKQLGIQRSTLDRRIAKLQTKLQTLYSV